MTLNKSRQARQATVACASVNGSAAAAAMAAAAAAAAAMPVDHPISLFLLSSIINKNSQMSIMGKYCVNVAAAS